MKSNKSKNIFEIAKKWNLDKKVIHEIDFFDFTSFFWPGLFQIFWPTVYQAKFRVRIFSSNARRVGDSRFLGLLKILEKW